MLHLLIELMIIWRNWRDKLMLAWSINNLDWELNSEKIYYVFTILMKINY